MPIFNGANLEVLPNGNFLLIRSSDDVGGNTDAGSVMLINGTTGAQIGTTFSGDQAFDYIGIGGVEILDNGNFVIGSLLDDDGITANTGSVILVDGSTGTQIGSTLYGTLAEDRIGTTVAALGNNNYVIASEDIDNGGSVDTGGVMLFNGATGAQIGATIYGDDDSDSIGGGGANIVVLSNGNYVIVSPIDNNAGSIQTGSVILVSGSAGAEIGDRTFGNNDVDFLGIGGILELSNGDYIIQSERDNNPLSMSGSVKYRPGS